VGTAFRLLQQKEKNSFRINESCTDAFRAARRHASSRFALLLSRAIGALRARRAAPRQEIAKMPVNWALPAHTKVCVQHRDCALDSIRRNAPARSNRRSGRILHREKKCAQHRSDEPLLRAARP
jgi:hypothetical protein